MLVPEESIIHLKEKENIIWASVFCEFVRWNVFMFVFHGLSIRKCRETGNDCGDNGEWDWKMTTTTAQQKKH